MAFAPGDRYRSGTCNIGPSEIAYRRRWGHVGLVVTLLVLGALLWSGAPPIARFLVALPAAGTAVSYLQAWLRFCAAYGALGVFNFGRLRDTHHVEDPAARARDRFKALQIVLAGALIGLVCGAVAVLL